MSLCHAFGVECYVNRDEGKDSMRCRRPRTWRGSKHGINMAACARSHGIHPSAKVQHVKDAFPISVFVYHQVYISCQCPPLNLIPHLLGSQSFILDTIYIKPLALFNSSPFAYLILRVSSFESLYLILRNVLFKLPQLSTRCYTISHGEASLLVPT